MKKITHPFECSRMLVLLYNRMHCILIAQQRTFLNESC